MPTPTPRPWARHTLASLCFAAIAGSITLISACGGGGSSSTTPAPLISPSPIATATATTTPSPTPTLTSAEAALQLKALFSHFVYVDSNNIYTDASRSTLATDGVAHPALNLTELVANQHLNWVPLGPRRSFLSKAYGFSHDRSGPIFKNPVGDTAHIFFPNVLDSVFASSATFAKQSSPNTSVTLFRSRRAVIDEGSVGMGVTVRDRGGSYYEITNFTGATLLANGSGIAPPDVWSLLITEDNGPQSRVYLNGTQLGTDATLPASFVDRLYYGTNSHVHEHDLKYVGRYNGIFTAAQRARILALTNSIVPLGSVPAAPVVRNPIIAFDGTDTFSVTSYTYTSPDGTPIDPASFTIDWFVTNLFAPSVQGWTGLDAQHFVHRGPTLKRSLFPTSFPTPGNDQQSVIAIVSCKDIQGRSWTGIPFRSRPLRDEIPGHPDAQKAPILASAVVPAAAPQRIVLTWSGGAAFNTTSGSKNDFSVLVSDSPVAVNAITVGTPNTVQLTLASPVSHSSTIVVKLQQSNNPLQDTNNKAVENFITGMFVAVENQVP
jgi:hypothetical protein